MIVCLSFVCMCVCACESVELSSQTCAFVRNIKFQEYPSLVHTQIQSETCYRLSSNSLSRRDPPREQRNKSNGHTLSARNDAKTHNQRALCRTQKQHTHHTTRSFRCPFFGTFSLARSLPSNQRRERFLQDGKMMRKRDGRKFDLTNAPVSSREQREGRKVRCSFGRRSELCANKKQCAKMR